MTLNREPPPAADTVCAVVITYHPNPGLPARLALLAPQVARIIVVDNGSGAPAAGMLEAWMSGISHASSDPQRSCIFNAENLGVARALNQGCQAAANAGHIWALLLDQDSRVDADLIRRLATVQHSLTEPPLLAMIGARFRDANGRPSATRRSGAQDLLWEEVEFVITSGTLLSLRAYAAIGPFRDEFFIDHIDIDYCWRARAAGLRVIETREPLMSHTIGDPTAHRLLGFTRWTSNHSADRRYYMARNNTVLLREHGTSGRGPWQLKSFARCFRLCKRIALYETAKARKIAAVAQGWWDGLRGNMGPRRR